MPFGPFSSKAEFISALTTQTRNWFTYAIVDKTRPPTAIDNEGQLAGVIAFLDTSPTHLSTEIGFVVILPAFHRTHVTTNAVGLMLQYALGDGGMGLRRVQWKASAANPASIRVAERMGFRREGLLRWHFVLRDQPGARVKVGNGQPLPPGSPETLVGRDTVVLGLCWDDWEQAARETVEAAMARTK
ncbi:acyl-CoA N-acyltransferase [Lasiosphaeria ovina]|uniref:Acyl-CoA N-acyltransferase n=1 Tax=Lasiosphaeria ovina TaxID=92902 RepID=A0AAE0NIE9_9PEZI|nr:acyl-CoA N-acyltransferase [Lasiosphaeria ovina]